jgi:phage terminase large subunit-like protein
MPWDSWRPRSRSKFAIRWIETYCTVTEGMLQGRRVKLSDFQKGILSDLLDGDVPPLQAIVSMPRGNGKTSLEAYLAAWHSFTYAGANVLFIATKEEQAQIPFNQVVALAEADDTLAPLIRIRAGGRAVKLELLHNGSKLAPLPSTIGGLQGRRPSLALVDEVGFVHDDVWSSMALGLGKHENSLLVGFGTPGFDRGIMWRLRKLAMSSDPPKGFLYSEYAAPASSPTYDEDTWRRANPAVAAGFLDIEALRANSLTETKSSFETFRLGRWSTREEAWLSAAELDELTVIEGLPEAGTRVILGFDGSVGGDRRDTTALVGCEMETGRLFVVAHWEPPEDAGAGWRVPRNEVVSTIDVSMSKWNATLQADPWFWRSELEQLTERYGERIVEQNTGSIARMAPLVDRLTSAVQNKALPWDNHPKLREHILAAVIEMTPAGPVVRKDARQRGRSCIDLAVAAILAYAGRAAYVEEPKPVIY